MSIYVTRFAIGLGVIVAVSLTVILLLLYYPSSSSERPVASIDPLPLNLPEPDFSLTSIVDPIPDVTDLGLKVVYNSYTRNGFTLGLRTNFGEQVRYVGYFFSVTSEDIVLMGAEYKIGQGDVFDISVICSQFTTGTNYLLVYQNILVNGNFVYQVLTYEYNNNNSWNEISLQDFKLDQIPLDVWSNGTDLFCIFTDAVIYRFETNRWVSYQSLNIDDIEVSRVARFAQSNGEMFFLRTTENDSLFIDNYRYDHNSARWLSNSVNRNLSGLSAFALQSMSLDVAPDGNRLFVVVNYAGGFSPEQTFYIRDIDGDDLYVSPASSSLTGKKNTTCCLGSTLPELNMWVTSDSPIDSEGRIEAGTYLVYRNSNDPLSIIQGFVNPLKGDPAAFEHNHEVLRTSVNANFKPQISWSDLSETGVYLFISNDNSLELWKMNISPKDLSYLN
jgi:hypothetical protein